MRFIGLILIFLIIFIPALTFAGNENEEIAMVADALIARPAGLVALGVGSGLFIISLPFAVVTGSVDKTAKTFIVKPFRYTFNRPLGDLEYKDADNGKEK